MGLTPFFSPDQELFREFVALIPSDMAEYFELVHIDTPAQTNEFLNLEIPELIVIDFRDPAAGGREILSHLQSDPWLLSCGILTIQQHANLPVEISELQAVNFLVGLPRERLADLFLGEMSFLLNRRRTATARSESAGSLISISRRDFVEAIREKPQYALVLSRLLAQRLERQNHRPQEP